MFGFFYFELIDKQIEDVKVGIYMYFNFDIK